MQPPPPTPLELRTPRCSCPSPRSGSAGRLWHVTDGDSATPRTGQASLGLRPHWPRRLTRPGSNGRGAWQWPAGSHGGISSPTPGRLQADPEPAVRPGKSSCLRARVPAASDDALAQELRGPCSGPRWVAMPGPSATPGGLAGGRVGALGPGCPGRPACPRGRSCHWQDRTWEGRRSGVPAAIRFNYVT